MEDKRLLSSISFRRVAETRNREVAGGKMGSKRVLVCVFVLIRKIIAHLYADGKDPVERKIDDAGQRGGRLLEK